MIFPVQYAVNAPIRAFGRLTERLGTHQSVASENQRLRSENISLRARSQKFAALTHENQRLRELLDSSASFRETVVGADVLAIETSPSARQIVIDKGTRQGAFVGQPVVDAYGILGQIIQAGPFSATALLVTDVAHAIPVQINRTGLRAICVGAGGLDEMTLSFVPTSADIKVGDLVVTSGLGDRFPAGYPVGEVTQVGIDHGESFAHIVVTPSAQVSRASEVLLVWPESDPLDAASMSAVDGDTTP
jgi:rod shape-determining protein MreC